MKTLVVQTVEAVVTPDGFPKGLLKSPRDFRRPVSFHSLSDDQRKSEILFLAHTLTRWDT
jgi:hypothetical protein